MITSIIIALWAGASLFIGINLLFSSFGLFHSQDSFLNVTHFLSQTPWSLLFGALCVIVPMVYIVLSFKKSKKEQYIAFSNPNGEVTISVAAVEDFLSRIIKEFTDIKESYPSVKQKKGGVHIEIQSVLWSGVNIPEITEQVQHEVKKQVQTILGIENISDIEIKVTKIETRQSDLSHKTDFFEEQHLQRF